MGSYYDIDAILTDSQVRRAAIEMLKLTTDASQKIPCTFDVDVPGLGYMEGNPGGDVQLPFARELLQSWPRYHATLTLLLFQRRSKPAPASTCPSGSLRCLQSGPSIPHQY